MGNNVTFFYFSKLDMVLQEHNDQFDELFDTDASPDAMHKLIISTFKEPAEGLLFCQIDSQAANAPTDRAELAAEKRELLKQRRDLKDHLMKLMQPGIEQSSSNILPTLGLAEQARLEHIQWRLTRTSNKLRSACKASARDRQEKRTMECSEHWKQRKSREAWRVALAEMGTAPGRRLRRFDAITVSGATTKQWVERCESPGEQGGFRGTEVDFQTEVDKLLAADG